MHSDAIDGCINEEGSLSSFQETSFLHLKVLKILNVQSREGIQNRNFQQCEINGSVLSTITFRREDYSRFTSYRSYT